MEKEFNLSKKRIDKLDGYIYREKNVKEFIKRLKEEMSNPRMFDDNPIAVCIVVEELIDKLAGEELSK